MFVRFFLINTGIIHMHRYCTSIFTKKIVQFKKDLPTFNDYTFWNQWFSYDNVFVFDYLAFHLFDYIFYMCFNIVILNLFFLFISSNFDDVEVSKLVW